MTGYRFALICPTCEGTLRHVNGTATGSESSAVAHCDACRYDWAVTVYVTPLETPEQRSARARKARGRLVSA